VPYAEGATQAAGTPKQLTDLPAGPLNHHWTKALAVSADGARLYATVGSNSNIAENGIEKEEGRAAIWEIDVASGTKRLFATGLRNPNGMDWEPFSGALWTAVNERDELGHNLVPDYITSVKDGAFYGWPWSYFGQTVDTRVKPQRPDMVAKAIAPDYALGAHTASLGLTFADGAMLGEQFASGAFIGQHGSWNRDPFSGYKVIFVPFSNGKPVGQPIDVLTGFIDEGRQIAFGRPVGVAIGKDGSLLVADDVGNTVWRIAAAGAKPPADLATTR
jgi:glucose/arabinose dehydrogenase